LGPTLLLAVAVTDFSHHSDNPRIELMDGRIYMYFVATTLSGPGPPHSRGFLEHTQRRTTFGRTPLDEWSACRRDLWQQTTLTTGRHPCLRWDSNPQSQQASGRRPMP